MLNAVQQRAASTVEADVQLLRCPICKTWYKLVYPRPMCTRERADGEGKCGGLLVVAVTPDGTDPFVDDQPDNDSERHPGGEARPADR